MAKYLVDCSVHWGSKYEIEAGSCGEAESKGEKQFLKDYALENHPMTHLLGVNVDVEEEEEDGQ